MNKLGKYRLTLVVIGIAIVVGASLPAFMTASCLTRQQTPAEQRALEGLRGMTRGGVLPAEDVVARIESDYPRSKAAALARIVRARIRLNAKDFAGAASLLDASVIRDHSLLGDYALLMRGSALEEAGRLPEARAAYEQLLSDYPDSTRAREANLRVASILMRSGSAAAVVNQLKDLAAKDDPAALLLVARAAEQASDSTRALSAYRRLYFYAPAATDSADAAIAIARLGSSVAPARPEEAIARADKFYEAKRFSDASQAYADAFARFPGAATPNVELRRVIAATGVRKMADALSALNAIPASAGETRAEALYYVAQAYARTKQWEQARASVEELRKNFAASPFTPRALVSVGQIAEDANNDVDASYFLRTAVSGYQGSAEVAQAQFDLAWMTHESKNFSESSKLLTEHLAYYADKNTDNRGRAGYWAARDSERAGKLAEARALYNAMQGRYDANWYGYLAKQRLDAMLRGGVGTIPPRTFPPDSVVARAIANLQTVTVAEETAGGNEEKLIAKSDELNNVGLNDWALEELAVASSSAGNSPKVNLAIARVYRSEEDNVRALNVLKKSFPDYSQMKPAELTPEQWDVFYPLSYWDIIVQESRAKSLDPYQVAGLIRQETVFMSRARSGARAYGLMQLLVPTGTLTAKKYGVERAITEESLYEPRLNIQLGTAYLRDQMDKFGRIEYVAAAYNAGPLRAVQWRSTLPAEMDEWAEAVPFKETRGYVQGVVRNRLQYQRLYDANGKFRPEVGTRAVTKQPAAGASPGVQPEDPSVRKRRVTDGESEE
ncbi:MAG TPA: transglycosylase SLT domain-containing protein [Pyrinomonadaceae bacterium]|nr:transglycosylase SLT domain-containing protein [Pyrinomonadaceae bacterium]